jgi:hypothetical protein
MRTGVDLIGARGEFSKNRNREEENQEIEIDPMNTS